MAFARVLVMTLLQFAAKAELSMTLSGAPESSLVTVTFAGSSASQPVGGHHDVMNLGWEIQRGDYRPFPSEINGTDFGQFSFVGGSATISFGRIQSPQSITGVYLQDRSLFGLDRFGAIGIYFPPTYPGGTISWTGTATIDLSSRGLRLEDLTPGDTRDGSTVLSFMGTRGSLRVVPEPRFQDLMFAGGASLILSRRRGGRQ
ncbi:MAG: hypothetical protein IT581_08110 [Verrucomicrobiales bacterium]|nr:hypothetical protein [Verrucomicrobiales bacterium]